MSSLTRIARAGLGAALLALAAGWALERARFGASDAATLARVQSELRDRLDEAADTLAEISGRARVDATTVASAARDPAAARVLFDEMSAALQDQEPGRTGITLYSDGIPIAWAGRVFDIPRERLSETATLFVLPGTLGPRLIRTQPVVDRTAPSRPPGPVPVIVVEQSLAMTETPSAVPDAFVLSTSFVPVTVRAHVAGGAPAGPYGFAVSSRNGGLTVDAEVAPGTVAAARSQARRRTVALAIALVATTVLLCIGPVLEMRRRATEREILGPTFLAWTLGVATLLIAALALILYSIRMTTGSASQYSPPVLLALALTVVALVAIALDLIERRRLARPRPRRSARDQGGAWTVARYVSAGAGAAAILAAYEIVLQQLVANASLDVLHFSLHPLSMPRIAAAFALVLLHAAAIWTAAVITRGAAIARPLATTTVRAAAWLAWTAGAILGAAITARTWSIPVVPLGVALAAAGVCGGSLAVVGRPLRRASQAARLGALFAALLAPALAMYPSLFAYAIGAKERLIGGTYGPQALSQREDLQRRVQQAVDQIESLPQHELVQLVAAGGEAPLNRAFIVWSRTDLGKFRMTSAVELYDAEGQLLSRFALHLPEYGATRGRSTSCSWEELFEEVSPFGSTSRHVLRTSRGICDGRRYRGRIVLRAMLDYQTLPFVSTQSPYLESLLPERRDRPEADSGRDVEFAMYGWSRAPIMESRSAVWTLPDRVFAQLVESRQPFWDSLDRGGDTFRVYFVSDRGEIYALGYPVVTRLGHITNLAELALLTGVLYALLLFAWTLFGTMTGRTPATAQGLIREIRSSFYRKLFLTYVAGAVVPVLILAVVIRTYFATQLRAGAVDAAQRTVTTAQRLVEDYAAIQQAASLASAFDDQSMVLVWRAIDEDVNLFQRARLQATSARDLFASSLLSDRTPGDVYKSILLDRSPTFVGDEKIGDVPYRLAAAPVRAGGRDGIVTVPLTNRQNEIEQQIDELDRRVRSAAVLFVLLGAGIGYWMAERIADPVNRLTRATRRIARGDLNARIAATSSDELRRLVEDFNRMAEDLQRQRVELERTQRLEAWAEMARQVAHDIKNPLTPIQLSAEHARRVNMDRGRPLSPVLDDCVNAILAQVRLLRQISAEFSSYATTPTPRPEPTNVSALVHEVVEAYRVGLAGRIQIDVIAPDRAVAPTDKTLFSRAVTNIIENALHAMPGNGRLTISIRPDADHIVVDVMDTGVGMDPEALAKIFEPYFSTKATGTGLGLTIAKRNIEAIGGSIAVRSERGVGTTVTLTIPV